MQGTFSYFYLSEFLLKLIKADSDLLCKINDAHFSKVISHNLENSTFDLSFVFQIQDVTLSGTMQPIGKHLAFI